MRRPYVITHALTSADGRLEGFAPDIALYYDVAGRFAHDAVLSGSGTMVAAAEAAGVDLTEDAPTTEHEHPAADQGPPLLVVVDSRGQVPRFDWIRASGLFRDVLVLGSADTPREHRARLDTDGVRFEAVGERRVDLTAALRRLHETHGVTTVRVDAGPGLNSALLAADLLDEVSLVLAPCLVGHGRGLFDVEVAGGARPLHLMDLEPLSGGHVWARYAV